MALELAARYNRSNSDSSLRLAKPSLMASSVKEDIHNRFTGF
jgi:hypothetical protein